MIYLERTAKIVGYLTLLSGVVYLCIILPEYIWSIFLYAFAIIGLISVALLLLSLNKGDSIIRAVFDFIVGLDLRMAIKNFLDELPSPSKPTISVLVANIVYRFTRIGIIGVIIALIPVCLLWQQNIKIDNQNKLVENQNRLIEVQNILTENQTKRLDEQTYLQEAERRSSLVFLFSNILDAIDREKDGDNNELSSQLIARIISLSHRLKPYRYLDGDSLSSTYLSPERGQLLVALTESDVSEKSLSKIFAKASFEYSDLRNIKLSKTYLEGADLSNSDFTNSTLDSVNLRYANIGKAIFENSYVYFSDLRCAGVNTANFSNTSFDDCKIEITSWIYLSGSKSGELIVEESYVDSTIQRDNYGFFYYLRGSPYYEQRWVTTEDRITSLAKISVFKDFDCFVVEPLPTPGETVLASLLYLCRSNFRSVSYEWEYSKNRFEIILDEELFYVQDTPLGSFLFILEVLEKENNDGKELFYFPLGKKNELGFHSQYAVLFEKEDDIINSIPLVEEVDYYKLKPTNIYDIYWYDFFWRRNPQNYTLH